MPARWRIEGGAPSDAALREIVAVLAGGGVVAYPTETLYGLGADAWNHTAILRVFEIKGRDPAQAISLIAADLEQAESWLGPLPPRARRLADAFWPGPLTLVLAAPETLPRETLGGRDRVGVRVSSHAIAQRLARALGRPMTATSANRSGQPAPADAEGVMRSLGDRIDGIVDAGPSPGGPPSTVVDLCDHPPRLIRAGAVPWERVVQFLSP